MIVAVDLCRLEAQADSREIDELAAMLENGFNSMMPQKDNNFAVGDVDGPTQKLRQLYGDLERTLTEARQRAANERSSITSQTIDRLRLI